MTPDELKALKDRVAAAEAAENRCAKLRDAMRRITDLKVREISLGMIDGPATTIAYRQESGDKFTTVCWVVDYPGLAQEVNQAVMGILAGRLKAAEQELAKI